MHLPSELWLEVFEWATYNPLLNVTQSHSPFQPTPFRDKIPDPNLNVRLTISLVCRQWRMWVVRSLFSDIKIKDLSSAIGLRKTLEKPATADGCYGEMVRRVVLQYNSTVPGPNSQPISVEILKLCPHIHTLLRPRFTYMEALEFDYETDGVPLPALQHLEWWHHNDAERSGGINSLSAVLRGAPNISYLFVGGIRTFSRLWVLEGTFPHLQTLRLGTTNGLFLHQIASSWSLPSLTYIILDSPLPDFGWGSIWNAFGRQLKAIEFGKNLRFFSVDQLSPCLNGCPGLEQLNYYLYFTAPAENIQPHTSLTTIRLHAAVNDLLSNADDVVWNLIDYHFRVLCGSDLPALRRIILHGDWHSVLCHSRFISIRDKLQDSNRILEISH